jgi:hypothetical protein
MVPSIFPGDLISAQRVDISELVPGEIVVFAREGRLIVHRVAGRENPGCIPWTTRTSVVTRGDRTRRDDGSISGADLIGRVFRIQRGDRNIAVPTHLTLIQWITSRLLRLSDRATYLYLFLAARFRTSVAMPAADSVRTSGSACDSTISSHDPKRVAECRA